MYYVYLENVILLGKYVLCLFGKCYTFSGNMYYVYLENVIHFGKVCIMFIWKMLYF